MRSLPLCTPDLQIALDGQTNTVRTWCAIKGLDYGIVLARRQRGASWPAAFRPIRRPTFDSPKQFGGVDEKLQ